MKHYTPNYTPIPQLGKPSNIVSTETAENPTGSEISDRVDTTVKVNAFDAVSHLDVPLTNIVPRELYAGLQYDGIRTLDAPMYL